MENMDRRRFLGYLGTGAAALAAASAGLGSLAQNVGAANTSDHLFGFDKVKKTKKTQGFFHPIQPSTKDELVLPKGFNYDVIASYGDVINQQGDTFGYNNDFTLYLPMNGSNERGLLWVNHEYINPLFVKGPKMGDERYNLLYNQGGSILEIYKENHKWKMDSKSKYARRITGFTPFQVTGAGASVIGRDVIGTFANCSGGMTLWNTVLTCEENYESTCEEASLDPYHYGWVCEINPFNPVFPVRKHTALGRFHHENTAMGISKDGRVVVYMGDDVKDACVYKFVSNGKFHADAGLANSKLLEDGTLYAADFKKGKWIPLTLENVEKKLPGKFQSQGEVLVHASEVAILLGATPTDRPEDVEISPFDNTLFIAHTNNDKHGNIHGHITRLYEKEDDLASVEFDFEIFAAGGRQSGFSAPDNLTFDSHGNLWTVTDISSSSLNKGVHAHFKNNGVFVIPTVGPNAGQAFQFASAPVEAELTGPWFTPDEQTLFLAVQHPGEETMDLSKPTSMWPHRMGDSMPRPSVVAITGFKF